MGSTTLAGRLILIVEDEPLIAMDLDETFESAGARVVNAMTKRAALVIAKGADLAAAVVDYGLPDGDSTELCACLRERKIPFMMYSGYPASDACPGSPFVPKPATQGVLLSAMEELLNLEVASAEGAYE